MRAILLAAGFGSRLRPLTDTLPKCLVPIGGRPLLGIWLDRLANAGMGPFLVNTHYLAQQVKDFVDSTALRDHVTLAHERELLGTAGTLIRNFEFFQDQDGLLIHADNYCLADLRVFAKAHQQRPAGCVMTMMTFRTNAPSSCGIVELDKRGVVTGFHEKVPSPPGNLANGAVYILSSNAIQSVAREFLDAKDFSTEVLPRFLGRIYSYETTEIFLDIGSPEAYRLAIEMSTSHGLAMQ